MRKLAFLVVVVGAVGILAGLPRVTANVVAGFRAQQIAKELNLDGLAPSGKAVALPKWAASHWDPKAGDPWFYRFTPFLYHRLLPEWVRLPRGSIELFFLRGNCNFAVTTLQFLLQSQGIRSRQLDFVKLSDSGHSALQAEIDGRPVFLDPFFGISFEANGRLLGFKEAQDHVRAGGQPEYTILRPKADRSFYADLGSLLFAEEGEPLDIRVVLSADAAEIGKVDGESRDVMSEAVRFGLTGYQHFLGARYSRHWRKIYRVSAPSELVFHLTEKASADALPASNITPEIEGSRVRYRITCSDCELVLDPKEVPWDWLRMKAWYDVDQLTIRPLPPLSSSAPRSGGYSPA